MAATSLMTLSVIVLTVNLPKMTAHRLITDPYPVNEWNSILVSSNPIRIYERRQNQSRYDQVDPNRTQTRRARRRSFEECPQNDFKCLYGVEDDENGFPDKYFDRYAESSDLKLDGDLPDGQRGDEDKRKSYWSMLHSQMHHHHHPYEDKNGWVTLDPVPWSTSKISKWHPNVEIQEANSPWSDHVPTTQKPVHQFWVSGSSYRPQKPHIQWGIGSNDIITDNKPSGFPTGNLNAFPGPNQHPFNSYRDPYKKFHQSSGYSSDNYQSRYPPKSHPATYPSQGNGEWVLLSTKKGYSQPTKWSGKASDTTTKADERVFWSRKIKPTEISRYHEEDLKRLLAGNQTVRNETEKVMVPLRLLVPDGEKTDNATKSSTRKVRLQVLPSTGGTSLSYGGMVEVDASGQTVNEDVLEEANLKKLQTVANVKKNKVRGFKLVPANRGTGKGSNQRSALTLAAVGAGMIPATMAVLLPMAIERSRRSLEEDEFHRNKFRTREKHLYAKIPL